MITLKQSYFCSKYIGVKMKSFLQIVRKDQNLLVPPPWEFSRFMYFLGQISSVGKIRIFLCGQYALGELRCQTSLLDHAMYDSQFNVYIWKEVSLPWRSEFSASLLVWRSAVRTLPPATLEKVVSGRKFRITHREWDDNACIIGAWHNSLDWSPPWYLVSPLLKVFF